MHYKYSYEYYKRKDPYNKDLLRVELTKPQSLVSEFKTNLRTIE